jgi:hypothetical protein
MPAKSATGIRKNIMVGGVSSSVTNAVALPNLGAQALDAGDISSSARAYLARRDNDSGTKNDTPQADTSRDPAVVISLSDEALQILDAMKESFGRSKEELAEAENAQGPFAGRKIEVADERKGLGPEEIRLKGLLRFAAMSIDQLASRQADYERISNTKPVPRQELTGEAKEAAFDLLNSKGYARPGTNQTVSFSVDNLSYFFKDDGSVWTNQVGVPVSEGEKQGILTTLSRLISFAQQDMSDLSSLSGGALNARVDDLYKQLSPPS